MRYLMRIGGGVAGLLLLAVAGRADDVELRPGWSVNVHAPSDCSPALSDDGVLYFGTRDGCLWAIGTNGVTRWKFRTEREIQSSPAVGRDGSVYFGSRDHCFYALAADGRLRWKFPTGAWVDSSPALATDGTVYFGSWDKQFYAVSAAGAKVWQFPTAGEILSSPAVGADGTIYFGSLDHKLYALTHDGKKKWEYDAGGPIVSSPALKGNECLYFTSVDGFLHALNLDGTPRWRLRTGGITDSSPVIGEEGVIYVGVNVELWSVTPDGKQRWGRGNELPLDSTPVALTDHCVCYLGRYGLLLTLDDKMYPVCHYYCRGGGHAGPAFGPTGASYITDRPVSFSALPSHLPMAATSWPKFRGNPRNTGNVADTLEPH